MTFFRVWFVGMGFGLERLRGGRRRLWYELETESISFGPLDFGLGVESLLRAVDGLSWIYEWRILTFLG